MIKHFLPIFLLFIATFVCFFCYLVFQSNLTKEFARTNTEIEQLSDLVLPSASIALFSSDQPLINRIEESLVNHNYIANVKLSDQIMPSNELFTLTKIIVHPYDGSKQIGTLLIQPQLNVIKKYAFDLTVNRIAPFFAFFCIIFGIIFIAFYLIIMKPLRSLNLHLANIIKGDSHLIGDSFKPLTLQTTISNINTLISQSYALYKEEKSLKLELEKYEKYFKLMFENTSSASFLVNNVGEILIRNRAATQLMKNLNLDPDKVFPDLFTSLSTTPDIFNIFTQNAISQKQVMQSEFEFKTQDDKENIWLNIMLINTFCDDQWYLQVFLDDISIKKSLVNQWRTKQQYDKVTELYTQKTAEIALNDLINHRQPFTLISIKINQFEDLCEAHHNHIIDALLKHIATSIKQHVKCNDILSHWVSGHFLIGVISNEKKVINNIVNDLENTLSAIFVYNDGVSKYELNLSLYIGISNFPEQATHLSKLIKQAKTNIKTKVI